MGERYDDAVSSLSSSDVNDEMTAASSFRSLVQDDVSTTDQASALDRTDFSSGNQVITLIRLHLSFFCRMQFT